MNKTFTKMLEIPKSELERWNKLLQRDDIDYEKEGYMENDKGTCKQGEK